MKTRSIIAFGTLSIAVGTSLAADRPDAAAPLTRAEVKKAVLEARAAGELDYGEEPNYPYIRPQTIGRAFKRESGTVSAVDVAAPEAERKKQ